jgi:hypothetical protein
MVPGMTERERRVADLQRLEWLADAVVGPARVSAGPLFPPGNRAHLRSEFVRRGAGIEVAIQVRCFLLNWWHRSRPLPCRAANRFIG